VHKLTKPCKQHVWVVLLLLTRYRNNFEAETVPQQPRFFSQMVGAFEVQVDAANSSNKVVRQGAPQRPVFKPATPQHPDPIGSDWVPLSIVGMKEWSDVAVAARFRLPAATAGACLATRTGWTFNGGIAFCVDGAGNWTLTSGRDSKPAAPLASGRLPTPPAVGSWHAFNLTTLKGTATAFVGAQAVLDKAPIPPFDSGFAGLGTPSFEATEFDDVEVGAVGPDWVLPAPPPSCAAVVGRRLFARPCQANGRVAPDQEWQLVPQSWHVQHTPSKLCATAAALGVGAAVELQPCEFTSPAQAFKNDYSNIYHGTKPLTLEAANLTLAADPQGAVSLQPPGWQVGGGWYTWRAMYSTGQLRNKANGGVFASEGGGVGPPMCLSTCAPETI